MANGYSLLERLRQAAANTAPTSDDAQAVRTSVLTRLERLLNTREGNAPAQPELGIPAPSEIAYEYPESIDKVRKKLIATINLYEPRLTRVQVNHVQSNDDILHLHFHVTSRLASDPSGPALTFTIIVGAGGDVVVRRPTGS